MQAARVAHEPTDAFSPENVIRPARLADATRICEIYNHYVRETVITFEEVPVEADEMAGRIRGVQALAPWLVAEEDGVIAGYAYATPWKTRSAYRFAMESTIYMAAELSGRGIGGSLYAALIAELRSREIHCAVGGIALPNPVSIRLHERLGFREIGRFREIGWKFGRWVDVGYWELLM